MEDRSLSSSFKEVCAKGLERNEMIGDEGPGENGVKSVLFFFVLFHKVGEITACLRVHGSDPLEEQSPPVRARGEELIWVSSWWGGAVWDPGHKWRVDPRNTNSSMLSGKKMEYVAIDAKRWVDVQWVLTFKK